MLVYLGNTCSLLITDKFLRIAAPVNWNGIEPRPVFAGVGPH
jgi:hypothetical protein